MNLADQTIFLKTSTPLELRTDGLFGHLAVQVADTLHVAWAEVNDVTGRSFAKGGDSVARLLSGPASMIPARARLVAPSAMLEWHFGLHPYTGEEASILELRVARSHLEPSDRLAAWTALATNWCEQLTPYWLGSHDTDLHAADNSSLALAASGFGIERTGLDAADPAGLENNRGTMRYCANWLTYHSAALAERLESPGPLPDGVTARELPGGTLYQLYPNPADGLTPEGRATQRAFRDAMGYLPAAQREQPLLGYWQKRGRP